MSNRLSTNQWRTFAAFGAALLAMTAAACASRALPASFPGDTAASAGASAAPVVPAAVALAEDPPLPGEPAARWSGLADDAPAAGHRDHAHGTSDAGSGGARAR